MKQKHTYDDLSAPLDEEDRQLLIFELEGVAETLTDIINNTEYDYPERRQRLAPFRRYCRKLKPTIAYALARLNKIKIKKTEDNNNGSEAV